MRTGRHELHTLIVHEILHVRRPVVAAETNFDRYEILRLAEMPKVETVIVPSYDFWGGVGEPTISVVTPAVLNAIAAATGKRVRELPLKSPRSGIAMPS